MLLAVLVLHVALVLLFSVAGRSPSGESDRDRHGERTGSVAPRTTLRFIAVAPLPSPTDRPVNTAGARSVGRPRETVESMTGRPAFADGQPAGSTPSATGQLTPSAPTTTDAPGDRASLLDTEATKRAISESARLPQRDVPTSPRLTPEARMTQALGGDGRLVEQDLGNGRWRYWQNGKCTESTATRASALFPEDTLPRPRLTGACP